MFKNLFLKQPRKGQELGRIDYNEKNHYITKVSLKSQSNEKDYKHFGYHDFVLGCPGTGTRSFTETESVLPYQDGDEQSLLLVCFREIIADVHKMISHPLREEVDEIVMVGVFINSIFTDIIG